MKMNHTQRLRERYPDTSRQHRRRASDDGRRDISTWSRYRWWRRAARSVGPGIFSDWVATTAPPARSRVGAAAVAGLDELS